LRITMTAQEVEYQAILRLQNDECPEDELVRYLQGFTQKLNSDDIRELLRYKKIFTRNYRWGKTNWKLNGEYSEDEIKFILKQLKSGGKW